MNQQAKPVFTGRAPAGPRGAWVPWFVLVVVVISTAAATVYVRATTRAREEIRFARALQGISSVIDDRVNNYETMLRGVAGLLAAEPQLKLPEFREYVERLYTDRNYPGIQGIGLTLAVRPEEIPALLERMHAQSIQSLVEDRKVPFTIWPDEVTDGRLHAIVYLEPLGSRNQAAIGYNMYSEPVRREAMARARDSGAPTVTGRVTLVQEIDQRKQAGFLMYVPMYAGGDIPTTVEQRRQRLIGFAYSPFRADDLLEAAFAGKEKPHVDFAVYDGMREDEQALLYRSEAVWGAAAPAYKPSFTGTLSVPIAERDWLLVFKTRPEFDAGGGNTLLSLVSALGIVIGLALFWTMRSEMLARAGAEQTAAENARLYESAQQARDEAERLNRLKDEFLATASHELRTPLNAILGWSQLLQKMRDDPETLQQGLETIERNAKAQAQLVEDLLDVSRIITGKLRLDVKRISLIPVVQAALETVRPAANAREIQLDARLDESAGMVLGDPSRLQQVVWNLLSNSIKFTPRRGRVTVTVERVESSVQITIQDTGQGITPEFLPHMFTAFRQADASTTRQHGGLGLGLAIVRHLVELHGGTVDADSPGLGHGSTFHVRLPVKAVATEGPADQGVNARLAEQQVRQQSHVDLDGLRILVVDDEPDAREVLRRVLGNASAEVQIAASAQEALMRMREFRPDVLVSDIGMPGEDGYSLVRKVRALPQEDGGQIPAIALTAFARPEDRRRALEAGFQLHLAKPVQPAELLASIAALTGNGEKSAV